MQVNSIKQSNATIFDYIDIDSFINQFYFFFPLMYIVIECLGPNMIHPPPKSENLEQRTQLCILNASPSCCLQLGANRLEKVELRNNNKHKLTG